MHSSHRSHTAILLLSALLLALALGGAAAIGVVSAPSVRAAGTDPVIHWDSNMIYPGQNNGYPWGPVGELVTVHGEKFTDSAVLGQPIKLALIKGDVNNSPGGSPYEFCKLAGPKIAVGQTNVDGAGKFDFNFKWPAAAGSGMYSICAYNTLDGFPAGNIDDGPFTVLSSSAPSIAVSRTSVGQGETITVTGKNWTPPQDVNVYIAACVDCDGPIIVSGTAHSSGLHAGTFSIKLTIPSAATPGSYVAGANAHGGVLDVGPAGGKHVTITAAAPTVTAEPSQTVAQATTVVGNGSGNGNADDGGILGGVSPLVLIIAGVGLLLLVILAILLVVMLARRGGNKPPASATNGSAPGWGGSGPPVSGFPGPGYGSASPPANGTVQQNWGTLPPGWGDQTPPTVTPGIPQGEDASTRANFSRFPDPAYPPAPPPAYPAPGGETPTQPRSYSEEPSNPHNP